MKFKLVEAAESKICCICKKPFDGYGNNAEPVCSGSCCDECNIKEVIPARMKLLDKSSSEDIDEAVLNETDESGNDEIDSNCDDCGAVITIPVDHDGPAYCANCMKNHLNEASERFILIGFNHFDPENLIVIHDSKENLETIDDDIIDYSEIIPATDKLLWIENNDEYLQVSDTNFNSIDEFRNAVLTEIQKNIDAGNNEFEILGLTSFYIDEDSEGLSSQELTDKFMIWIDESYVDGDSNSAIQLIKGDELDDHFVSYTSIEEFLESFEGDMYDDFDESLNEGNLDILNTEKDDNKMNEANSGRKFSELEKANNNLINKIRKEFRKFTDHHYYDVDAGEYNWHVWNKDDFKHMQQFLRDLNIPLHSDNADDYEVYDKWRDDEGWGDFAIWNSYRLIHRLYPNIKYERTSTAAKKYGYNENPAWIIDEDDNKMNEDMSVRAKLKALYPELNFGDKVEEAINEGNSVSGQLPPALDSFLQDIAQMYGTIDYGDIMDHNYSPDDIRKLNNLRRRFITWSQYDEDDEEVKAKFNEIANKVAEILKRVEEGMNEAAGNKVTLEVMFEEYERYDIGRTRKAKVSGKDLLSALKRMVDKMSLYITSDEIEEDNLSAEEVIEQIEEANGDGCDFIFYIKNLTTGEMLLQDNYENEEDWDDEDDHDDDTDFDIDESHETRLMSSLYEGSDDFDDYDDEADEGLEEGFSEVPESREEHGLYIWKISFDNASGEYEATNDVDGIYAHGITLKDCIEHLRSLVNEQAEIDGSVVVKKFSDKHVDYSERDLDNLGYVIVKFGRFRFW